VQGLAEDLAEHRALVGTSNAVVARELVLLESLLVGREADIAIVERLGRAWKQRSFRAFYERPLLLGAALRLEALQGGAGHPLALALATEPANPGALTRARIQAALDPEHLPIWLTLATRKVQTNDVSRAVAWRWPATLARTRPLVLVDVGCSAGLGLVADAVAIAWSDRDGRPVPRFTGTIAARVGFDAEPVDATAPDDAQWLRACVWPGDVERQRRLESALAVFATMAGRGQAPAIERVRAKHVYARLQRLERAADRSALVLVVQSFVREYLDESEAMPYVRDMEAWLRRLPPGRALWVQLELAGDGDQPPAEIVAHASGGTALRIARCGYHPDVVDVDREACAQLRRTIEAFDVNARP
jgi:hypothetical protein